MDKELVQAVDNRWPLAPVGEHKLAAGLDIQAAAVVGGDNPQVNSFPVVNNLAAGKVVQLAAEQVLGLVHQLSRQILAAQVQKAYSPVHPV